MAPAVLAFCWLRVQKSLVKQEVAWLLQKGVERELLVLLEFSREEAAAQLRWEHKGEFEYRGQMYDVVERASAGDTLQFWCWHDEKETELNEQLTGLLFRSASPQHRREKQEQRFYCLGFLPFQSWFQEAGFPHAAGKKTWSAYAASFSTRTLSPPAPPPRLS
jgi:hypothetical protein